MEARSRLSMMAYIKVSSSTRAMKRQTIREEATVYAAFAVESSHFSEGSTPRLTNRPQATTIREFLP